MKKKVTNVKKEFIIPILIAEYSIHIKQLKEEREWEEYLRTNGIHLGICSFCYFHFEVSIFATKWVLRNTQQGSPYWMKIPCSAYTRKEAINLLKRRVRIMKRILARKA